MTVAAFPLVLPHQHVRRILDKHATLLILTKRLPARTYEVHDRLTVDRNRRHIRDNRRDLTTDTCVFTITTSRHAPRVHVDSLTVKLARSAGWPTSDDWRADHPRADLVFLHEFRIDADERYLHRASDAIYTRNPALGLRGEGQALSAVELQALSADAQARYDLLRAEEVHARRVRSISIRLRDAGKRGDRLEVARLSAELAQLVESPSSRAGTVTGTLC